MADITFEKLVGMMVVALVLIGAYNTIMTAIKTHREETRRRNAPVDNLETTIQKHDERLKNDHERLTDLEKANRIQMRALMAMLHHEIDGNSTDGLKKSYAEIQQYLIDK